MKLKDDDGDERRDEADQRSSSENGNGGRGAWAEARRS